MSLWSLSLARSFPPAGEGPAHMAHSLSFLGSWLSEHRTVSGSETCAWEELGMARQGVASQGVFGAGSGSIGSGQLRLQTEAAPQTGTCL